MAWPRVEGLEFGDLLLIGRVLEFKKVYITGSLCFADGSSVSLAQERIGMQKVQECVCWFRAKGNSGLALELADLVPAGKFTSQLRKFMYDLETLVRTKVLQTAVPSVVWARCRRSLMSGTWTSLARLRLGST